MRTIVALTTDPDSDLALTINRAEAMADLIRRHIAGEPVSMVEFAAAHAEWEREYALES